MSSSNYDSEPLPEDVINFFETEECPATFKHYETEVAEFVERMQAEGRKMVCVTSGGSIVPLERNMVRFLDNFSSGTRGAASTEHFLQSGYAVIFLHRRFSRQPFSRHFSHHVNCFLDHLETDENDNVQVSGDSTFLKNVLEQYQSYYKIEKCVLHVEFVNVVDYLFMLRMIGEQMAPMGSQAAFYLAAAISDYYIPNQEMTLHKIQSSDTHRSNGEAGLMLDLHPVPKMLRALCEFWAPESFVCSFKLETDPELLLKKANGSIDKYHVSLVVANLLSTRSTEVRLVTKDGMELVEKGSLEIENPLVDRLTTIHDKFIADGGHNREGKKQEEKEGNEGEGEGEQENKE